MDDSPTDLRRYIGRYATGWNWHDGLHTRRFMDVAVEGDHLVIRHHSETLPINSQSMASRHLLQRQTGHPLPLVPLPDEHTFNALDRSQQVRFIREATEAMDSVVIIRDGEASEPCPRQVLLPAEEPGRRDQGEWFDLGHPTLCMTANDTEAVVDFYERLGFVRHSPKAPGVLRQGWTVLGFLDFQPQPCINYRGPSILGSAIELAKRGYTLDGAFESTHIQGDGGGSFMVYDPDGHRIFFNTHPVERPAYDAWKEGTLPEADGVAGWNVGAPTRLNATQTPVTLPLGDLVVTLDVVDLETSTSFYRGMGFAVIDQGQDSTTLFSHPARENRFAFPVRLHQANEPRYSFGFHCPEVERVSKAIKERGIEVFSTPDGPAFDDPDGNRVTLLPALQHID